jgi:cytochrome P450
MDDAQAESDVAAAAILPHYNMWDPEHEDAKWDVFSYARRQCPVAHTDADGGGQYVVTRYDDVRSVLEDPQTFSSAGVAPRPSPVQLNPLDADPPYQVDLRRILNPLFTRNFLLRFEPELRKNAVDLIGRFIDNGRLEFVREYAGPFVGDALSRVVFNEDDPEKMERAAEIVIRVAVENTDEAYFELAVLAGQYIAEREANPVERTDVLNAIATGTVDGGRPLTDDERLGVAAQTTNQTMYGYT